MNNNDYKTMHLPLSVIKDIYYSANKYVFYKRFKIYSKDSRYLNFIKNGTKCALCGLEGKYCKIDVNRARGPHLNVYGIDEKRK